MHASVLLAGFIAVFIDNVFVTGLDPNTYFHDVPGEAGENSVYTEDPVYTVGDSVKFGWSSTYDKVGIIMWQQYPIVDPANSISLLSDSSSNALTWKVSRDWLTGIDDGETAVAYLALYESGSTTLTVISHYFNLTSNDVSSTSKVSTSEVELTTVVEKTEMASIEIVTEQVTATASVATTDVTAETDGPTTILMTTSQSSDSTSSSISTSDTSSDSAMPSGKAAGISIGTILGLISVLGGAGFTWRRKKRAREAREAVALKMQQQSSQSTQIHITQSQAPAAGYGYQDAKPAYTSTNTPVYPSHVSQHVVTQAPVQPQQGGYSSAQNQPAYAPPAWTRPPENKPAELGGPENQQGYGHGSGGTYEAP